MTFKGFTDSKRLLDRSQYFSMLEGKKISAMLPRSWKKSFNNGIIIPTKTRWCIECKNEILCTTCNNQINENKEFEANLNLLKRKAPNEFGHILPYHKEQDDLFVMKYLNNCSKFDMFYWKGFFYINKLLFNKWAVYWAKLS